MLIGLFLSALILLFKACVTKDFYEKLLIANSFSTHVVLIVSLFAFYSDSVAIIDIALVYAFISFFSAVAFLYYFQSA